MENRIMPIDFLDEFVQIIQYFAVDPVKRLYPDPEYKRFFFGEFLNGIIKKIVTVRELEPEHQHIIPKLLMSLVDFFGQEIDRDNVEMADAMRWLFNQSCTLHMCMFQSEDHIQTHILDPQSIISKLSPEDIAWRKGLKEGEKIDAVKIDMEYNLKMWAKATITMITNDILHLLFDDDVKAFSRRQVHWYSFDIAPYNTKSAGDEWRKELKVGDYIDAFDSTKSWYQSIIHGVEVVTDEGREVIKYKVGFMMYHPEGNKEDDDGRKFFGWSDKFDETISAYSPRIQKFQSYAKVIGDAQKDQQSGRYDDIVDDQMDQLIYDNNSNQIQVFAIVRRRNRSALLVQFLNRFGEIGGYQKILDKINKDDNDATTIELVFYYIDAITAASSMFNRVFLEDYLPKLEAAVKKKILSSSSAVLRLAKKDRIDGIVRALIGTLKGRLDLSYQEREQEMCLFNLQIASLFLKQQFLEKRIDGAKIIQEVSKTANLSTYTSATEVIHDPSVRAQRLHFANEVINKLKEGKVLFEIFSQERGHSELVQRSEELLKLFITQNSLSQEELEYVWASTKLDETTRLELFKHFHELSSRLREHEILYIINQLDQVPLNKIIQQEIELVHELTKRSRSAESSYGPKAIDYFWKIAFSNNNINAISDIIKNWNNENKHILVKKIIDNLNKNMEGLLSIKMLKKIIMNFSQSVELITVSNKSQYQQDLEDIMSNDKPQLEEDISNNSIPEQYKSKNNYICHLEFEYGLLELFFSNFVHYLFQARIAYRKKCEQDPNFYMKSISDVVLCEKFIHSEQISERLDFLRYVISNSHVQVQIEQLSKLWNELVVHALSIQDTDMFYQWLKEVCDDLANSTDKNDSSSLVQFFQDKFSQETNVFKTITQDGFNCIQSFIIFVNEFNNKIIRVVSQDTVKVQKFTAYNNVTGKEFKSYSFNQNTKQTTNNSDEELDFLINTEPQNIDGIEAIWKIATEANEQRVYEKAMQLLVKLYSQPAIKLVKQLPQFDDEFLCKCIQQINQSRLNIQQRLLQPKDEFEKVEKAISAYSSITTSSFQKVLPFEEKLIMRYLQLIKEYIKQSERLGTLGVRSHQSLLRGELLHSIQVSTSLGYGKETRKFEVAAQSNTTLWDFRIQVARLNPEYSTIVQKSEDGAYHQLQLIIPDLVTLYRYTGVTILKDTDNARTLGELKFKPNEQLNAYESKSFNNQAIPLLNSDKTELSENARFLFTQMFERFSIPDEENPDQRIMTRQTCGNFIQSVTEEDQVNEEDLRVLGLFEAYDLDKDDKIQLNDFLEFYKNCCLTKELVVRDNLTALKYRQNLTQFREDFKQGIIIYQQRERTEDMPRYKLSSNQIYFDSIFSLLDSQNEIAQSSWNLIKQMTTKPDLYHKIKNLNLEENFSWDQVIDSSSIYKILYTLQVIESMLEDVPETYKHNFELNQEKSVWIERFLSVGGFQEILKLFEVSLSLLSQKPIDLLSKFEKNFLEYMLKLIRIFIMSAFAANDATLFELINLVKRSSSIQEKDEKPNEKEQPSEQQNLQQEQTQDQYTTPNKKVTQQITVNMPSKQLDLENVPITEDLLFGQDYVGVTDDNVPIQVKDGQKVNGSATNKNQQSTQQRINENENERFSELAKIMRETGLGEVIIEKINFRDLQKEILEIISLILSKKEINSADDMILENNFSLWVAILVKNDDLINDFYSFERPDEKAGMFGVKNADQIITTALYTYKSFRVREEITNTLTCIATKVQKNKGKLMLFYLLDLLERNFPREDQYYLTRESKCFFELFMALIDEYFNYIKQKDVNDPNDEYALLNRYDMYNLLRISIEKLKRHQTKETKSSLVEDKALIGYFNIIEKLVVNLQNDNKQQLQSVINDTGLLHELFYEQLFFDPRSLMKLDNKCKTKESRTQCYSTLTRVIESLEPKELAEFLENDLWGIIKDLKKPKTWKYVPSENSKQSTSYVGITNLGNICYMVAMLQQFFMVPQFRYHLLKAEDDSKPDIQQYKGLHIDDNMLRQLQRLFGYLELSEKQEFNPTEFCFSFKDYEGNPTNTALQSDTQEFLNIFFDRLENTLKPTSQRYLLDGVFGGNTCSQLICQSCGNIKNIKENFYNLSLPVKERKSLDNSLSKMIEGSIINDYRCGACNEKVNVFKRTLIGETPNVLIVHLQRLVFNFDTFQNDKINTRFEFPNLLNLKEYSYKHVMEQESNEPKEAGSSSEDQNKEYVDKLMQMEDSEFIYKLVGVIIHRGTGQHGHYWSLINTKRGGDELDENKPEWVQTERDAWREFNDETVKFFSFSDLKQEAFGGSSDGGFDIHDDEMNSYLFNTGGANSYGKSAYMLVYERQKKKDLVVLQKKQVCQNEDQSLECADTANSRDDQQQQQEEFEQLLQPYRKIEPFVPDWIRAEVSQDNVIFLMDRYIYCEPFFNLLKSIFKHIANKVLLCQHHYSLDYLCHFTKLKKITMKLAHKTVFELLAYYYYNHQLSDILNSLQSIIQFCDSSYSLSRGSESILNEFLETAYFEDVLNHFMKVALECTDKSSRYYVCKLTTVIINKVYRLWDEAENKEHEALQQIKAQVDSLIVHFVATLGHSSSYQNWSRMEQFLQMMYDIAQGGHSQARRFLSTTDIIPHLIEYMLGNRSPSIKNGKSRKPLTGEEPYFEPIVKLICLLTRYTLTKEMVQNEIYWDDVTNPQPSTLLGYDPTLRDRYHRFELSDQASQYFFNSIFIDYIQYMGYDTLSVGNMLAHLSYKSLQTTRVICESQLRGISKNDFDRVKNYLDAVTQIVLVRDNLQNVKLEWIFGIAQPVSYDQMMSDSNNDEPKTRIGVKVLFSNNDEVYAYKSYLCTNDSLDSLLHLLWRYKGRMDSYTVSCLLSLMNIIAQDDSIAEYFSNIPGPTYQYARYTDWIKPYLNEQLIDARKGYAGTFSQQKEENVIKALSLYEKYEKYLEEKDGKSHYRDQNNQQLSKFDDIENINTNDKSDNIEENVKNLIDQMIDTSTTKVIQQKNTNKYNTVIPCTPQPYIILECIQENFIDQIYRNGVQLQIISLDCQLTKSEPTGYGNLSMPKNLFTNFRDVNRNNNNAHKNRERELQTKCIDNYFQSSNFRNKNKNNNNNYDNKVIQDDDKQWKKVNDQNVYDIDDDETGYTQDNEDNSRKENMQDADQYDDGKRHNSGIDEGLDEDDEALIQLNQQNDNPNEQKHYNQGSQGQAKDDNVAQNLQDLDQEKQEPIKYKINIINDADNDNNGNGAKDYQVSGQVQYNDKYQDGADANADDQSQKQEQEIVWPNGIHINQGLVLKYIATNNSDYPVKICIEFVDQYAEENDENNNQLNNDMTLLQERYRYPKGCLEYQLNSTQTKTLIFVQKHDPWNESGTYEKFIRLSVVQLDSQNNNNYNDNNPQHNNASGIKDEPESQQLQVIDETEDQCVDPQINVSNSNIQDVIEGIPHDQNGTGDYNDNEPVLVDGMKQCPTCTFLQDPTNIMCELCETRL